MDNRKVLKIFNLMILLPLETNDKKKTDNKLLKPDKTVPKISSLF